MMRMRGFELSELRGVVPHRAADLLGRTHVVKHLVVDDARDVPLGHPVLIQHGMNPNE